MKFLLRTKVIEKQEKSYEFPLDEEVEIRKLWNGRIRIKINTAIP